MRTNKESMMANYFTSIAYAIHKLSEHTPVPIGTRHAQELFAAALGYKKVAALQASDERTTGFSTAQHFVLDFPLFAARCLELSSDYKPGDVWPLLHAAFAERLPTARVHGSDAELDLATRAIVREQVLAAPLVKRELKRLGGARATDMRLPFLAVQLAALPALGDASTELVTGYVKAGSGNYSTTETVAVTVRRVLARAGRTCMAAPIVEVVHAEHDEHADRKAKHNLPAPASDIEAVIASAYANLIKLLSDAKIVRLAAYDIGIAYFPESGVAIAAQSFIDHYWRDSAHYQYWGNRYGPAVRGGVLAYPEAYSGLDFEALFLSEAEDPDFHNAFEEKMSDPTWVSEIANAWRAALLTSGAVRDQIEIALDNWRQVLENGEIDAWHEVLDSQEV
jgi:hypothetical protein